MKNILLVFGTRPEAIKMAPLVKELKNRPEAFRTSVCVTGQHREMLDQVLRLFDIRPDYDLDIMRPGQDLYDITARVLTGMRDVLDDARPETVLVHGDTTTSTAAALAAFYRRIPVGHVEAGLRTHHRYNPWPEEMNRQLTARIASLHFAPTALARENLLREAVDPQQIVITGNTIIDALHLAIARIDSDPGLSRTIRADLLASGYDTARSEDSGGENSSRRLVLITGHRRENFGSGFDNICRAIHTLCRQYPDTDFVYPMHPNPNVREPIARILAAERTDNLHLVEPLAYPHFVYLMKRCTLVLTDSGGIQEEAPGVGKPVLVMRETTERPEAVESGTVKLVGTDYRRIVAGVSRLLDDPRAYRAMSRANNPYGDGKACRRIADALTVPITTD